MKYPNPSQVWQRVHPADPGEQQTLQTLLIRLNQDQSFLLRKYPESPLLQQYRQQSNCLKGILILTGGRLPKSTAALPSEHSLGRCYEHALQRLSACQLRSADPVYGPVFRNLSQETERHCRLITELLGSQ